MTDQDRRFWMMVQRRANTLAPSIQRDLLAAFRVIRESLSDAEMARIIAEGRIDQIVDQALLDRAFLPLKDKILAATKKGFDSSVRELPQQGTQGKVDGEIGVAFNTLSPKVIDAVRAIDTRVVQELSDDMRDMVRASVEDGLVRGVNPREIGRHIRDMVGIGPTQTEWVENYRAKLEEAGRSPEQIDRMVGKFQQRIVNRNAETVARTATLDSLKLGRKLSVDDAIAKGILDPSRMTKTWVGVMDDRERPSHVLMEGQTVPYDQTFSNGQMIPGDDEYNCRCIARYSQSRAA